MIWNSPLIPGDPIVWRKNLSETTKDKIYDFFMNYGKTPEEKAVLKRLGWAPFRASSDLQLVPIRQLALFKEMQSVKDNKGLNEQDKLAKTTAIQAQLDLAKLNLSFTRVTSPISGRVSRAEITAGNLVTADTTALTSVVSTDKVYAYFDADERVFLKYTELAREGRRGATTPVYLGLSNETGNPHLGQMNFVDNQVNPATGTIRGRAVFDNSKGEYTPGLYARLKLVGSGTYSAVLINDEAVGTDLGKKFVLVMDADNKSTYRAVDLGPKIEGLRIVRNGLNKDDTIIVKGLQKVRPGSPVTPEVIPMANEQTLAALAQQRQALEASNLPQVKPANNAPKLASVATPRG